jgi:hypothetical protein
MTACGGVISHQMKGPPAKTVVDSVAASCHSHIRGSSVSVKGKHPYAAFLRVSVGCLRVIFFFQFKQPEPGPWLWAPASPKFPSMSWHPRPAPSIPASRSSFKQRLLKLLVGNFRCLPPAMASRFAENVISIHAQRRTSSLTPSLTPPQAHELSSWIWVPGILGGKLSAS